MFDYNTDRAWYIVHTRAGAEEAVKERLEKMKETRGLGATLFEMFVPYDSEGKTILPTYLFINAIMDNETWFTIRNTRDVFGFIGSSGKGAKPIPVREDDMQRMLNL